MFVMVISSYSERERGSSLSVCLARLLQYGASGAWGPSVIDFPFRRSKPLVTLRERGSRVENGEQRSNLVLNK